MSGHGLLHRLTPSTESMKYQGDAFFKEITVIISSAREMKPSKAARKEIGEQVQRAIKKFTNINAACIIEAENYHNAAAYILPLNIDFFFDEYVIEQTAKEGRGKKKSGPLRKAVYGSVNTSTGKVDGMFAKVQTKVVTSDAMIFSGDFTPEEIASIMMHEIGHLFTTLLLSAKYTHGTQGYMDVVRQFEQSDSYGGRATIIKRALKDSDAKVDDKDIKAALEADRADKDGNYPGTATLMLRVCQDNFDVEAGKAMEYTHRVLEQMADEYAMKHGCGTHLASAMDKFTKQHGGLSARRGFIGGMARAGELALLVASFLAALATPQFFILFALSFLGAVLSSWLGNPIYDSTKVRFDKMADQLAIRAKDKELSSDEAKRISEEYMYVKKIAEYYTDEPGWATQVITTLAPPFKRRARFTAAMVELERLASSELYVQSQRLKHA